MITVKTPKLEGIPDLQCWDKLLLKNPGGVYHPYLPGPQNPRPSCPFSPGVTFMRLEPPNRRDPGVPELQYEDFK